jgi:hypothetical protein
MTNNMDMEKNIGKMGLFIKEIMLKDRKMDKEILYGQMELIMLENLRITKFTVIQLY